MEMRNMQVLLVGLKDYVGVIRNINGLRGNPKTVQEADLVIDRDTGQILKARF